VKDIHRRMAEDKALRDAALALFKADLANVRADLDERGLGARIKHELGESTMDVIDDAVDFADEHKGAVAATVAAGVLWFARRPILAALGRLIGEEDEDEEPGDDADRSEDE
jgi:hypothetical protein